MVGLKKLAYNAISTVSKKNDVFQDSTELMYPLNIEKEQEGAIRSMGNTLSRNSFFIIIMITSISSETLGSLMGYRNVASLNDNTFSLQNNIACVCACARLC